MGFKDEYDFDLVVNDVKDVVIDEIEKQLEIGENRNTCRCEDCILDITALALNHLKPNYRSSLSFKGVIYKQRLHTDSYQKAVEKVVRRAIEKISKNPSHETS